MVCPVNAEPVGEFPANKWKSIDIVVFVMYAIDAADNCLLIEKFELKAGNDCK